MVPKSRSQKEVKGCEKLLYRVPYTSALFSLFNTLILEYSTISFRWEKKKLPKTKGLN